MTMPDKDPAEKIWSSTATNPPSSKQVSDFHRNADTDLRLESIHHTIGTNRYQAASGDHIHDGSTGSALLGESSLTANLATPQGVSKAIADLAGILSETMGLKDNVAGGGTDFVSNNSQIASLKTRVTNLENAINNISLPTYKTASVAAAFSAASGSTIQSGGVVAWGNIAFGYFNIALSTAIGPGNITNTTIASLKSAWRPRSGTGLQFPMTAGSSGNGWSGFLSTTGDITIASTIASMSTINGSFVYLL